jgi:hypothetical protein
MILYMLLVVSSIFFATYIGYYMLKKHKIRNHTIEGNFFVNGCGKVGIDLCQSHMPKFISVHFTDQFNSHPCHPCNPHHDTLHWELIEECGVYQLKITYDVGNVREISYNVIY